MNAEVVDQNYTQLQQQGQQTANLVQTLANKLQNAAAAGDQNAREWSLDLKEIALAVQQEEGQTSLLLQSIHTMVDNQVNQAPPQPQVQQPQYQQPQYQQPQYQQPQYQQGGGGGMFQRFLGGGFGQAIMSGAGFGIGDDIINKIL